MHETCVEIQNVLKCLIGFEWNTKWGLVMLSKRQSRSYSLLLFCYSLMIDAALKVTGIDYGNKKGVIFKSNTFFFSSFSCVHCSVIFADVAALKSHIQGSHCEIFYKCPICPMAFKSAPGTHSHAYTQHPGVKIGEPKWVFSLKIIFSVWFITSSLSSFYSFFPLFWRWKHVFEKPEVV